MRDALRCGRSTVTLALTGVADSIVRTQVAVIGAGYAGMSAAMDLADAGFAVSVYEAGIVPGGRARRIPGGDGTDDNGQHLLIGAYTELLGLLRRLQVPVEAVFARRALRYWVEGGMDLQAPHLPAPWHLAMAFLLVSDVPWRERLHALRMLRALQADGFRARSGESVTHLLDRLGAGGRLRAFLWEPLCVGALNTPPERACAQIFLNLLHDIATGPRSHSDLLIPRTDLSALFPEPAAAYVTMRHGSVHLQTPVTRLEGAGTLVALTTAHGTRLFSHVIVAVAPRSVSFLLGSWPSMQPLLAQIDALDHERIATLTLEYAQTVRLPFPMMGVASGEVDWIFDRRWLLGGAPSAGGRLACVLSAPATQRTLDRARLTENAHRDVERLVGRCPPPVDSRLVVEKTATFSCRPGLVRPDEITHDPRVLLAGDYLASRYPATLETAVRSGRRAAAAIIHWAHAATVGKAPTSQRHSSQANRSGMSGRSGRPITASKRKTER